MQEHGIQQNVQIAKTVDHTLKNQLQYPLPTRASTRSSLPSCSCKSGQLRIRFTLRRGDTQEMCRFPQGLEIAIHETMIRVKQLFEQPGGLERDRAYDPIVHAPRLLIVKLVDLGGCDQLR